MKSLKDEIILLLLEADGRPLRIGEIMSRVQSTKEHSRAHNVLEEMKKTGIVNWNEQIGGYSINRPRRDKNVKTVHDLDTKLSVLERLEKLMAPDISGVLKKIHSDLMRAYTNA